MALAEKVARVTKIKIPKQGVGSNIEVVDAESSLKEAQVNYYNALYDAPSCQNRYGQGLRQAFAF